VGIVEQLPASQKPYSQPRPIDKGDDLAAFDCGKPPLDEFLKQHALKNEGKASRTYVVAAQAGEDAGRIVAYYTLAAGAVSHDNAPGWAKRNMPDPLPAIVLGRLAVDRKHQGKSLGQHLLREAMQRTLEASAQIGARVLIVHAVDDEAINFYVAFGFRRFPTDSRTLFLPIETIVKAL
jgi:ribosomal protein S18 acetylase RimI-like enzyme